MDGDPPKPLVDRAYDVGAFATAAPTGAVVAEALADRRIAIRAFGIIQIVLGGILGLLAIGTMVTIFAIVKRPAAILGGMIYGLPAANLLVTGIGSVKVAGWARTGTVISAGIWLVLMVFAAALVIGRSDRFPIGGGELAMLSVVMVPVLLIALGLPIALLIVYTRPSVRATFERHQAS